MSGFAGTVLCFVVFIIIGLSDSLVELPQVAENDILNTETIIRATANKLFTSIKLKGVKKNSKLKQYGLIHNYFVSLTLKDYKNLNEIARLTRVDKKTIDNTSINFIDLINEILNEDSLGFETKSKTSLNNAFNDEVESYIDDYSHNIAYLRTTYGDNSPRVDINKGIINILENDEQYLNTTANRDQESSLAEDDDTLLKESEFWVPEDSRRIFQGKRTKIKYFPFMASIAMFNNFQCGGCIISNDLIITAASCLQLAWNNRLFKENPAFLSVRIGSNYYDGGGESLPVLEVYFYPTYNPKNLNNNIAIMRLVRKINFKRKRKGKVKKIDFDRRDSPLPMNVHGVTIIGWGAKSASSIVHSPWENKLSFAVLDVYMLKDCQDTYSTDYVSDLNFCAGFISKGGGACNRDVGGPGIVSGVLTGIISFGSPVCGTPDAPTVFTKVGYYADWIEEIIQQDVPFIHKQTTRLTSRNTFYSPINHKNPLGTLPPIIRIPYGAVTLPLPLPPSSRGSDKVFKQFLKTMFDSKEIDEYLDLTENNKDVAQNNADIIGLRQDQLAQIGPYLHDISGIGITPIQHTTNTDEGTELFFSTIATVGDESFKALESSTKADDIQIFNPDLDNNIDNENFNDIVSSVENTDLQNQIDSDDDVGSRKELENNIMKLIDNVNLKEKIAEAAKKDSTILDKDQDLDNTILTLLYMSDSENQGGSKLVDGFDNKDQNGNINVENDDNVDYNNYDAYINEVDGDDEKQQQNLGEDTENMYDHQELRLNDDETQDKNGMTVEEDLKSKNVGELNDVFSKKVLYDILSEVIDYQNKNKTVNTT